MSASQAKNEPEGNREITVTEPDGLSSQDELRKALYRRCASFEENHVFSQNELLSFNIIPNKDVHQLLVLTRHLANDGLFKVLTRDDKICWRVVSTSDAAKYKSLNQDEALVFSYIEASSREGIWTKILRVKTNLHMTTLNRAIKSLENKNIIKAINNVKFPNRKTYILAKMQPSEAVRGGPFHTNGKIDEEFVHILSTATERFIIGRSWGFPTAPKVPEKRPNDATKSSKPNKEEAEKSRAESFQRNPLFKVRSEAMKPFPPSYAKYPTVSQITRAINDSKISNVVLKESEMIRILDILRWDGRIEKVSEGKAYRAVRMVAGEGGVSLENGLTESPCGRCPVFDICEDGGPVNAKTCEYFQEWLQL